MKKIVPLLVIVSLTLSGFVGLTNGYRITDHSCIDDSIDMVIIAPELFSSNIQPLIKHKNCYEIVTILKTVESIYDEYDGRDEPEQIKYFIKDAIEEWNINYVLIIGSKNFIPMRKTTGRVWLYQGNINLPTDHYYSDIYNENRSFSSWDTNNNDRFGEFRWDDIWDHNWDNHTIDFVDLYPDVIVGRLPCETKFEVSLVVNRIISYETQTFGKNWFKKIVLMGGDTSTYSGSQVFEGELVNDLVAQELEPYGFSSTRLWTSTNTFKPFFINFEISKGAGFVCYSGHGFDNGIATYPPHGNVTVNYITPYLLGLLNINKLPIVFLDACLTSNPEYSKKFLGMQIPCFAWSIVKKSFGGAIASIGATQRAYTYRSSGIPQAGSSKLCITFYGTYEEGVSLGQMFFNTQNEYLDNVGRDYYTIEEFVLLGDPSLKVGGYPLI